METKMKRKLPTTNPVEVIKKIEGKSHKSFGKPFASASTMNPNFRRSKTSKACMHGSRIFRYVRVNYPYKEKIQPSIY